MALRLLLAFLLLGPGSALGQKAAPTGRVKGSLSQLRLPARYRLARMKLKSSLSRLRLPARYRLARMKLKRTPAARGLKQATMNLRGGMTRLGDRIELNLPPALGRGFHKLRRLNPLSLSTFTLHKLRQDPWFFSAYGTWSFGLSNTIIPLSMALGAGPLAAGGIRLALGLPVDLTALFLRQHHLMKRKDPGITWGGTLRRLGQEFTVYTDKRRQENRAFMAAKTVGAAANLRGLAAPLMPTTR